MDHYEIKVLKDGEVFLPIIFSALQTRESVAQICDILAEKFPLAEGYSLEIYWNSVISTSTLVKRGQLG